MRAPQIDVGIAGSVQRIPTDADGVRAFTIPVRNGSRRVGLHGCGHDAHFEASLVCQTDAAQHVEAVALVKMALFSCRSPENKPRASFADLVNQHNGRIGIGGPNLVENGTRTKLLASAAAALLGCRTRIPNTHISRRLSTKLKIRRISSDPIRPGSERNAREDCLYPQSNMDGR